MRKIGTFAVLALGLASSPSVSQDEKPGVRLTLENGLMLEGATIKLQGANRFVWGVGISTGQPAQARVQLSKKQFVTGAHTARAAVVTENGDVIWMGDSSEPLMHGDMEIAVKDMETISQRIRNGEFENRLAALDDAGRAVMKARRTLGRQEAGRDGQEPNAPGVMVSVIGDGAVWRLNGNELFFRSKRPAQTPMQELYDAFTWAVTRVRQAAGTEAARTALDEVEKSIHGLRSLFWEQKTDKD